MNDFIVDHCTHCDRQFIQLEKGSKSADGVILGSIMNLDGTIECGPSSVFQYQHFAVVPDKGIEPKDGMVCDVCLSKMIGLQQVEQTLTFLEGLARLSSLDPLPEGDELDW